MDDTELEEMFFHKYGNTKRSKLDELKEQINEWTIDTLTDQDKMQTWMDAYKSLDDYNKSPEWEKRYSLPSAKENALDELFGVSK